MATSLKIHIQLIAEGNFFFTVLCPKKRGFTLVQKAFQPDKRPEEGPSLMHSVHLNYNFSKNIFQLFYFTDAVKKSHMKN